MKEKLKGLFKRGKMLVATTAVALTSALTAVCACAEEATTTSGSVIDKGIGQSGTILTFLGDLTTFIVSNELCLCFLGFFFISRAIRVLKSCLRVTPR